MNITYYSYNGAKGIHYYKVNTSTSIVVKVEVHPSFKTPCANCIGVYTIPIDTFNTILPKCKIITKALYDLRFRIIFDTLLSF